MMLEVAFYGQSQSSFTDASAMIKRAMNMEINKETVRDITEAVGRRVFEADTQKAEHLISNMHEIEMSEEKDGRVLYITRQSNYCPTTAKTSRYAMER